MTEPIWLLKAAVPAVHNQMIAEFGRSSGIRDERSLDCAMACPINLFNYDSNADLHDLAAAYAGGIVQNHPFVDGNKRTGFMAAYMFLGRNGLRLNADEVTATTTTVALASSEIDEEAYSNWLRQNTVERSE